MLENTCRTEDKLKMTGGTQIKQHKMQQNKTTLVQSPLTTLGQLTRWAYSTMLRAHMGHEGN